MDDATRETLAELSRCYRDRLVVHARRILGDPALAEDVVQEVLMRAGTAAGRQEPASIPAWLYAATARAAIDRLRARNAEARALEGVRPAGPAAPGRAEDRETAARLASALHDLPDPYRSALVLRYLEGLEFREIAARLETIERTARTWVGRGLTRLRERMGDLEA